ncbi:MAG: PAS domain S-box protein [Desulfobacterales bacterium]|nr:MAG: PAS domain S-box protein [Desulfobacterales bacterium]
MEKKPSYEELEKRVQGLEGEVVERKQAEQALRENQERYKALWDDAPVAYHMLDTTGTIKHVNHTELDMLGYTRDEMVGKPIFDFILPEQREAAQERFRLKLTGKHIPKQDDRIYVKKDGSKIYVSIDDRLEYGPDSEVLGVRSTMVDVSQQKWIEDALRESEEKYRNVVERSNDGIVIIQNGVIKYANPSLAKMTGYDADEAIDKPFTNYIDPDEVEESLDLYSRRLAGEQLPSRYERGLRHKNGSRVDTEIDAAVITYQDKPATLVIIRDITERKQAEETLRKSSEQIKLLAYSVSHDLKGPAIGIYGLTKLLHKQYRDILGEKGKNYCDRILETSEQIAALVGNLNIYISTKEMPLNVENIQLKELLQMVRDEFSAQLDIREITWSQPERMPEIRADRLSVLRILRNLVDNALKHGGDDLSEITIGYEASDEFHKVLVSNDGVPIKLKDPEQLFGPFQRHETAKGTEGTGLGLAIVKELAEQHGGMVRVQSGPERGTAFYIFISRYL